jgi:hypothetical protein
MVIDQSVASPVLQQIYQVPLQPEDNEPSFIRIENYTPYTLFCNFGTITNRALMKLCPNTAPYASMTFTLPPHHKMSGLSIWIDNYPLMVAARAGVPSRFVIMTLDPVIAQSLVSVGLTSIQYKTRQLQPCLIQFLHIIKWMKQPERDLTQRLPEEI